MPLISTILISSSSLSCIGGLYYLKKYQDQAKEFDLLGNSLEFDFDQITEIKEIPLSKILIIHARTEIGPNLMRSKFNNNQELLFSQLMPKTNKNENLLFETKPDSILRINLVNIL